MKRYKRKLILPYNHPHVRVVRRRPPGRHAFAPIAAMLVVPFAGICLIMLQPFDVMLFAFVIAFVVWFKFAK